MGLLNRNNSGRTFDGQENNRGGFLDVVRWQMEKGDLVYKFPHDNLTTGTTLIVHENQKAFLFKNGAMYDSFGPNPEGHKLSTGNIPFLQKLLNIPTGGQTTFVAEVWFVNTEFINRDLKWGAGELLIEDPYYDIPITIGAYGQYGIKIGDPAVFLKKMVSTLHSVTTETVCEQFRLDVIECFKNRLHEYMDVNNIGMTKVGGKTMEIGKYVKEQLVPVFEEYGIEILNFNIGGVNLDKNDPGYIEITKKIAEVSGQVRQLGRLGNQYAQVRQLDIMEGAANNEGSAGGAMGMGMGMGMGVGMGNMMGNMMGNIQPQQQMQQQVPPPLPAQSQIYIAKDGETMGPYSVEQIQGFVNQNLVTKSTMVWKNGFQNWISAESLPELLAIFNQTPPPPPPPSL